MQQAGDHYSLLEVWAETLIKFEPSQVSACLIEPVIAFLPTSDNDDFEIG